MTEQTSKCLAWTPNTEARSSWRWLLDEIWRQLCYLFMSFLAWRFHGPICFNPHECCRRNRFLFTLIKIIFCGARSNGQNVTSMTLFSLPAAITQQAALLFASFWAIKDKSPCSCMLSALLALTWWSKLGFMELMWQCQYVYSFFSCLLTSLNLTGLEKNRLLKQL